MKNIGAKDSGRVITDRLALENEVKELRALKSKSALIRLKWYFSKSGPGWMQSAMTLGGGSAMASLFSGAFLQYQLLWVQPVAMLMGIIMLSALAYQTLSTQTRPFQAMKEYVSPFVAWMWAICTLISTLIWHFPQYSLASGMLLDLFSAFSGIEFMSGSNTEYACLLLIAVGVFVIATSVVWNYEKGRKGIRIFENIVKGIVWFILFAFAGVVISSSLTGDGINWSKVLKGFSPLLFDETGLHWNIPSDTVGVSIFIASLSAAVGLNMTFLFGYSFLKKGWGKEHKELACFDMITGMLIPYVIAVSLMIIAAGSTLHTESFLNSGSTNISPILAASMLESAGLPPLVSRLIFGLGIIGMSLNAIIMHMLVCGFAVCEMFNIRPEGWKYRLATLIPVPGIFGAILWSKIGTWIAIPTSAIALIMLPVAYIGFFLLNNSERYLKEDMPRGKKRFFWNIGMLFSIIVTLLCACYYVFKVLL